MIGDVEYFGTAGPSNTERCLEIAESLTRRGINDFVAASTTGNTGVLLAEKLHGTGCNVVVVGHSHGFREPGRDEFLPGHADRIRALGGRIYRGTILTHSLETGLSASFGGTYPTQIIAATLRLFGQGMKVCCEIVMEACDAGLIDEDRDVAAIGGTGRGADTVVLIRSRVSKRFLELRVLEILAKPRG